jgi:hypothetical protein
MRAGSGIRDSLDKDKNRTQTVLSTSTTTTNSTNTQRSQMRYLFRIANTVPVKRFQFYYFSFQTKRIKASKQTSKPANKRAKQTNKQKAKPN